MMTPGERRGARWVAVLLVLGSATQAWEARRPPAPVPLPAAVAESEAPTPDGRGLPPPASPPPAVPVAGRLDLTRATTAELDALPGIGPVLAGRIVAERQRRGGFRSADDLLAVPGIGPRLLERIRPLVRIGPAGDSRPAPR